MLSTRLRRRGPSRLAIALAFAAGLLAACSDDSGTPGDGGVNDAPGGGDSATDSAASMTLTSSALSAGGMFMAQNTCAGANQSPPLAWTAGPAGTSSYAVSLTDLSIDAVHWVIWDIPAGTTSLPAGLPGDTTLTTPVSAKQIHKVDFFGAGGAYRGPCPSGQDHMYQFRVNAIGAATLPGVAGATTSEAVNTAVLGASLAHGDLNGTSNARMATDGGGQ